MKAKKKKKEIGKQNISLPKVKQIIKAYKLLQKKKKTY